MLQNYKRFPVVFTRGEGTRLFDDSGKPYLDFLSGIGVASLGHAHPALTRALADQAATLLHTSNLYFHPLQGELAARLTALSGTRPRLLLQQRHRSDGGVPQVRAPVLAQPRARAAPKFVAFWHGFHGRTMGALSVTWDEHYRTPFEPLVPGATFLPTRRSGCAPRGRRRHDGRDHRRTDSRRRRRAADSPRLAAAITEARRRTGALVIADEVQSGRGARARSCTAAQIGLTADLVALAKALGAGVPVGAVLWPIGWPRRSRPAITARHTAAICWRAGRHSRSSTSSDTLHESMARASARLFAAARRAWRPSAPDLVTEVRGAGLIAGHRIDEEALPVVNAALERGLVVNRTAGTVVRLLPPYIVTEAEVDEAVDILRDAMRHCERAECTRVELRASARQTWLKPMSSMSDWRSTCRIP